MKKPTLRFSGRLYFAAQRMQRLAEKLNELEGRKMLARFGGELLSIEESVSEFERCFLEQRKGAS